MPSALELTCLAGLALLCGLTIADERPSIVLIMTDDMGSGNVGFHGK